MEDLRKLTTDWKKGKIPHDKFFNSVVERMEELAENQSKINNRLDKIEQATETKQNNNFSWFAIPLMLLLATSSFGDNVPKHTKDKAMDLVEDMATNGRKALYVNKYAKYLDGMVYAVEDKEHKHFAEIGIFNSVMTVHEANGRVIYSAKVDNENCLTNEEKTRYSVIVKTEIEKYYNNEVCVMGVLE